jgi:hypothetical protein
MATERLSMRHIRGILRQKWVLIGSSTAWGAVQPSNWAPHIQQPQSPLVF